MKTNLTTFGNTVATANHAQILNLKAGTEDWLTNIHVSPGSGVVGHGIRLYDEIVNKNRMCMHIIGGLLDAEISDLKFSALQCSLHVPLRGLCLRPHSGV